MEVSYMLAVTERKIGVGIHLPFIGYVKPSGVLERFSVDVNRNNKGVPRGAQIRFGLL
jgi:hypothetical protein